MRLLLVLVRFLAGFIVFNVYSIVIIVSYSGVMLFGVISVIFTRLEVIVYTLNFSRRRSICFFVRLLKENMSFCLMIKLKSRFAFFFCSVLTNN